MRIALIVLGAGFLVGCGQAEPHFPGEEMVPYFPFDGVRTWDFISTDMQISYKRQARMRSTEPDVVDGTNTYPLDYEIRCIKNDPDCESGIERTLSWSSNKIDGVMIWYWTEGNEPTVYFDPPLQIADVQMKVGEAITTETGGAVWTSTLVAFEDCPIRFNGGPSRCARFSLTDGDDNPETGKGLVGDYWAGVNLNIVGFQFPEDEEHVWQLQNFQCDDCAADNGRW